MKKKSGFSLIELMVVMSIVGLLMSAGIAVYSTSRKRSNDSRRLADIDAIQKALELYYLENGQYPPSGGATAPNGFWSNSSDGSWTTLQGYLTSYMPLLARDPQEDNNASFWGVDGKHYSYFSAGGGCAQQWYMIVYSLEIASGVDPGVTDCSSNTYRYGGGGATTAIKTVGRKQR